MYMSINQAVNTFDELVRCYYECNTFGSHTAEVYMFRTLEHCPALANNPDSEMFSEERERAKQNLRDIIAMFESRYPDAKVHEVIGPNEDDVVRPVRLEGSWRWYLRVIKDTE